MKHQIRRSLGLLFKLVLIIIVIMVLAIVGLNFYAKYSERSSGSRPPPGYEDRIKYSHEGMPGSANPNQVPVDLWFGKHDGKYDTTHLRVNSEYLTLYPFYHGEGVHIMVVWPSMLSLQAYGRKQKQEGHSADKNRKQFSIVLSEAKAMGSGDKNGTASQFRCDPVINDKNRGVKYCNEVRNIDKSIERFTNYWPLDDSLKTPWYKNPPKARCNVIERDDGWRFDACSIFFSFNADIDVTILFVPEELAIDIITDFSRLTDFLNTLEVKS